jgi:Mn2+/Fe2+ NRAMP family transporter
MYSIFVCCFLATSISSDLCTPTKSNLGRAVAQAVSRWLPTAATQFCIRAACFFYLVCEAISTAATPGLLCQPRVIVKKIVEKQMECRLAGETEVFGENLSQRDICPSQNPT